MSKKKTTRSTPKRKKANVDPCPAHPAWTLPRYRSFIRSAMRRAWVKWPPRSQCLQAVKRPYTGTNPRQRFEYQCARCTEYFSGKHVSVDHITSWGKIDGLSIEEAWSRLLVPLSGLQVLCEACHDAKTAEDKLACS